MRYLLDVNALIALGIDFHNFHPRVASWFYSQREASFLTCSITEIGFVRIVAQVPAYGMNVNQAQHLLLRLKENKVRPLIFVPDERDISSLPARVKTPAQITDGHLVQLVKAHGAQLATLDERIPDAYLIPPRL